MAKAKRRAKPRRTSSAGRPVGGKLGAGRGKAAGHAGAATARKAPAGKVAAGKGASSKPTKKAASKGGKDAGVNAAAARTKPAKAPKPPVPQRSAKATGDSRPKVSPSGTKASTVTKPGSAASVGPTTSAAAKAPRKLDNRVGLPIETAADTHRGGGESVPSERANEVTAQGFAPAAPAAAGGDSPRSEGASGGLPVPIASFTI